MYEKITPQDTAKKVADSFFSKIREEGFDTTQISDSLYLKIYSELTKNIESIISNTQLNYIQLKKHYNEIYDRKDRVHNRLNNDYLCLKKKTAKLENKVKRKYYRGMPKEVREELKKFLNLLETSIKFDVDSGVAEYEIGEPERDRYESFLVARDQLKELL